MLTAISGRYSNTLTFTYDHAGRLASEALTIGGQTYTVGRGYDAANRLVTITYPDGSVVAQSFTASELLQQVYYQGSLAASFTYDVGGRPATRTLGDTPATTTTWGYVTGGDLTATITTPNLPSLTYTYDPNKNKTSETISGVLQPYGFSTGASGYDNEDQLVNWNRADNAKNQSWTLTKTGDWQQFVDTDVIHARSHNAVHELTVDNTASLTYDGKGNLTSNPTTSASYVWDFENRLQQATVGSVVTTFGYDALGRRVSMTAGAAGTIYVAMTEVGSRLPLWRELAEYAFGAASSSPSRTFVFATHVDEPLLLVEGSARYCYHTSALGTVVFVTDAGGILSECYAYTPFGSELILAPDGTTQRSSSAIGNALLYTARRVDTGVGLYYCRARYYSASLGRFISRDPLGMRARRGCSQLNPLRAAAKNGAEELSRLRYYLNADLTIVHARKGQILSMLDNCSSDNRDGDVYGPNEYLYVLPSAGHADNFREFPRWR